MENEALTTIMCVIGIFWLIFVVSLAIYFHFKIMPVVREMQKTTEGQLALNKLMHPPRFRR